MIVVNTLTLTKTFDNYSRLILINVAFALVGRLTDSHVLFSSREAISLSMAFFQSLLSRLLRASSNVSGCSVTLTNSSVAMKKLLNRFDFLNGERSLRLLLDVSCELSSSSSISVSSPVPYSSPLYSVLLESSSLSRCSSSSFSVSKFFKGSSTLSLHFLSVSWN